MKFEKELKLGGFSRGDNEYYIVPEPLKVYKVGKMTILAYEPDHKSDKRGNSKDTGTS